MAPARFGSWTGAGLCGVLGVLFLLPGGAFTDWSYDFPFSLRRSERPEEVVLVTVDEQSHERLGQPLGQLWDRALHAALLDRLRQAGAKMVVFDFFFSGVQTTNDAALARAMQEHGRVLVGSHARLTTAPGGERALEIVPPSRPFSEAAAGQGLLEVIPGSGDVVRRLLPGFGLGKAPRQPALAWTAAQLADAPVTVGGPPPTLDWYLRYYGPPGTLAQVSYADAIRGAAPALFTNKIVLVGEQHNLQLPGARGDTFRSPYITGPGRFDGTEIHATALANLLRTEWLRRLPPTAELAIIIVCGVLIGWVLPRARPFAAITAALGGAAVVVILAVTLQFAARTWFSWLIVVAIQIPAALGWALLFQAAQAHFESRALGQSLAHYLPPSVVRFILDRPELLHPGGEEREISILVTDIANFSKLSELMDAEDLMRVLNQYYAEAMSCIREAGGSVVNLIGDAIFAIWNAPQSQPQHAHLAGRAGLALQARLLDLDARLALPPLRTRVGLHCGEACVGNVGSTERFSYTAVGAAVNLTFRLEALNKHLGTRMLASRDFRKAVGDALAARMVGHFRFKGFGQITEVHEILGPAAATGALPWMETFEGGMHAFLRKDFESAEEAFQRTLAQHPDDGPSIFYLAQIARLRSLSLPADWQGELDAP